MKKLRRFLWASVLLCLVVSCRVGNTDTTVVTPDVIVPNTQIVNHLVNHLVAINNEGLDLDCFTLEFPFSVQTNHDATVAINSTEAFEAIMTDSSTVIVDFVFPIQVLTQAGEAQTLQNIDEMSALFAACVPNNGWSAGTLTAFDINSDNSCYELVYPVILINSEGVEYPANTPNILADLIASQTLFYVWPIQLQRNDGQLFTANSSDELLQLLYDCGFSGGESIDSLEGYGDYLACFKIIFPINIQTVSGDIVSIVNGDALLSYLIPGNFVGFEYPIQLETPSGQLVYVFNDQQLSDLTALNCEVIGPQFGFDVFELVTGANTCYQINFPIGVNTQNGLLEVTTFAALLNLISSPDNIPTGLVYPITVTLNEGGFSLIINNEAELHSLLEACGG